MLFWIFLKENIISKKGRQIEQISWVSMKSKNPFHEKKSIKRNANQITFFSKIKYKNPSTLLMILSVVRETFISKFILILSQKLNSNYDFSCVENSQPESQFRNCWLWNFCEYKIFKKGSEKSHSRLHLKCIKICMKKSKSLHWQNKYKSINHLDKCFLVYLLKEYFSKIAVLMQFVG